MFEMKQLPDITEKKQTLSSRCPHGHNSETQERHPLSNGLGFGTVPCDKMRADRPVQ